MLGAGTNARRYPHRKEPHGILRSFAATRARPLPLASALCQGRIGHFVVDSPMVIGHESAGEGRLGGQAWQRALLPGEPRRNPGNVPCYANTNPMSQHIPIRLQMPVQWSLWGRG